MKCERQVKYSVVIPLHNKEEYIKNTLQSVLKQSLTNFEIVVVDDGSTDSSVQKVFEIDDSRIKVIQKTNGGVSSARNRGIKDASGDYICFLDADDTWKPDFLETVDSLFEKFPAARIACPSYEVFYGKRTVVPRWKSVSRNEDCLLEDFFEMATAPFWIMCSSCICIEKNYLLSRNCFFNEKENVYEDLEFWLKIGCTCPIAHSNRICATYNRITSSNARTAHSQREIYNASYMNTLDYFYKHVQTSKQREWIRELKDRRVFVHIFSILTMGNKKKAFHELYGWKPTRNYWKHKMALFIVAICPTFMVTWLERIKYKLF